MNRAVPALVPQPKLTRPLLALATRLCLVVLCLITAPAALAQSPVYPKGTNITSFNVITDANLANNAQKIMIATLQGLVAHRSNSQIFIDLGSGGYPIWRDDLRDTYGIPYTNVTNPWLLLQQYAPLADGYILYNQTNGNSVNAANSLCGPLNAVAVDASIETTANLFGLTKKLADVSALDEKTVWTNYNALFSRSNVVELENWHTDNLRDYATLANAFTFFDGNSGFRTNVMSWMDTDSACFGWGDASNGEDKFVGPSSQKGVYTVAANWALDISTLSSVRDSNTVQRTFTTLTTETNVHYVTFVSTDGDNLEFDINGFYNFFNNPARGNFNMGYGLNPSIADLAPSVARWYFDHASSGPNRDFFVSASSGCGYFYPSMYPASELPTQLQKLNDFMARLDLSISTILDFNSYSRLDLWNQYLAQPAIDAIFYWEYAPYHGAHGAVSFSTNGKPVIAARESLWAGLEEDTNVIANVNSGSRDIFSPDAYSMVAVHVWDKDLGNVQNCVTNFSPDVRVVTPDAFAKLILQNVGRQLSFDFSTGAQGWVPGKGSKSLDSAQWTTTEGSGALQLDGSDFGVKDNTRNSWFSRAIILPPNATTLRFDTRALHDGRLRVRVKNSAGTFITLLDWDTPTSTNWITRTVNVSSYAGQVVTFYFEQNDGGLSSNETRYVDNVAILTSGTPLYLPAAPRLFAPAVDQASGVALTWRADDTAAAQFHIERLAAGGAWEEIATVDGTVTNFTDSSVAWGTSYEYRLRGWNNSGFGPYSTPRDAITPAIVDVIIDNPQATFTGTWLTSSSDSGYYGSDYRYTSSGTSAGATFVPTIPRTGLYAVYIWYPRDMNATTNAQLLLAFNGGTASNAINENANTGSWQLAFPGTPFTAGTNASLSISANTGEFGKTVLADAVKFVYGTPPDVAITPSTASVTQSNDVTFTAAATGNPPFTYQWRFNTAPLPGATNSNFTITNTQPANAGSYCVVVTNLYGITTSADATLTVNIPVTITAQPQNQSARANDTVTFSVTATGTGPLAYQWQFNSTDIPGATTATCTINNVQTTDAGTYSVLVSNVAGSVASSNALLVVNPTPVPASTPRLSDINISNAGIVTTTWTVDPAVSYTLQFKDDLRVAGWTTLTNTSAASSTLTIANGPITSSQRFYQLYSSQQTSDIAGFLTLHLNSNSDTFVSLPFTRPAAGVAIVDSVSNNLLNIRTAAQWTQDQFVYSAGIQSNTYYARFISGAMEGRIFPVLSNSSSTLTLNTGNDNLAPVATNDLLAVEPYWTLGTVFPSGNGINISPTTGNRNTEVLLPNFSATGINLSAAKIYYFNAGFWKIVGQGSIDHSDDILQPGTHFIVRHNVATNTTLIVAGAVAASKLAIPLITSPTTRQDNFIGLMRPVTNSLNQSGLITSGAFNSSPLPGNRTDELLVFDNSTIAKNKSASAIYYYWSNAWRRVSAGTNDVGDDPVFIPGCAAIIRKDTSAAPALWINSPNW